MSTFHGTLFIISRKYFSVFRSPHLPLDIPCWTRCFPLVMQSRKAGFPFATRARKREPCLQRYVSRMTRTEKKISKFFWKPLFSTFYGTLFIISRKYFFGFSKSALRTYPSIHHFGLEASPLYYAIWEGRLPLCNTSSEAGALPSDKQ